MPTHFLNPISAKISTLLAARMRMSMKIRQDRRVFYALIDVPHFGHVDSEPRSRKTPFVQNEKKEETRSISKLLTLAVIALAIPALAYSFARLTGSLPTLVEWQSQGSNHGPWRNELQGFLLYLPFLATFLTIAVGVRHLTRNHFTRAIRCLGLAVVQGAAAFTLLALIGWTID